MGPSKAKNNAVIYIVIGLLIAAPVFYALGYTVAKSAAKSAIERLQTKYELTNKALEVEVAKSKELESRIVYLETTVRNLTKILDTVYASVKEIKTEGNYDTITVTVQALYIVPRANFCISIDMKNNSDLQKTLEVQMVGNSVLGQKREITLYPNEKRKVDVCGTLQDIAANANISINGTAVASTVVVVE